MLPPTILTEAVAQVGAILILAKPENREKLIYFMGIERVRYRRPVHPGDVVVIEAIVRRLRSRMGVLRGIARVDGKVVVEGTMTFAPRRPAHRRRGSRRASLAAPAAPSRPSPRATSRPPTRVGVEVAPRIEHRRRQHHAPIQRSSIRDDAAMPRVSRSAVRSARTRRPHTPPTRATLKAKSPSRTAPARGADAGVASAAIRCRPAAPRSRPTRS